ncbi:MAG TPA: hypothetical protein VIY07_09550 [Pseudolabrys sp.]
MISKYPGICIHCKRPTKAGVDHYDLDKKESYHAECRELAESGPTADEFAAAERCGYAAAAAIDTDEWFELYRNWHLLPLPPSSGSPAAGRAESEALRGPEPTLFAKD